MISTMTKWMINPEIVFFFMEPISKHGLSFFEMASEIEGEDYAVAKELVENLFYDMAFLSTKYDNDQFCDLPYTYRERQLDSILLPALSKLCDSKVFVELPTRRQCSNRRFQVDESSGRIDYWCLYKDYSFVIELKHSYDCFTTDTTREDTVTERWIKMNEQLQSIAKDARRYSEATKGVIRIGLHIITSYSDKNPDNQLINSFKESIPGTFDRFTRDLGKRYPSLRPNVLICWKIPSRIVMDLDQSFPGLWCIGKVYPAIKHQGAKEYRSAKEEGETEV